MFFAVQSPPNMIVLTIIIIKFQKNPSQYVRESRVFSYFLRVAFFSCNKMAKLAFYFPIEMYLGSGSHGLIGPATVAAVSFSGTKAAGGRGSQTSGVAFSHFLPIIRVEAHDQCASSHNPTKQQSSQTYKHLYYSPITYASH